MHAGWRCTESGPQRLQPASSCTQASHQRVSLPSWWVPPTAPVCPQRGAPKTGGHGRAVCHGERGSPSSPASSPYCTISTKSYSAPAGGPWQDPCLLSQGTRLQATRRLLSFWTRPPTPGTPTSHSLTCPPRDPGHQRSRRVGVPPISCMLDGCVFTDTVEGGGGHARTRVQTGVAALGKWAPFSGPGSHVLGGLTVLLSRRPSTGPSGRRSLACGGCRCRLCSQGFLDKQPRAAFSLWQCRWQPSPAATTSTRKS